MLECGIIYRIYIMQLTVFCTAHGTCNLTKPEKQLQWTAWKPWFQPIFFLFGGCICEIEILENHKNVLIMKGDLFQDTTSCVVKWLMHLLAPLDSEPAHLVLAEEYFASSDVTVCYNTFQKIPENLWRKCIIGLRLMNLKWFGKPSDKVWEGQAYTLQILTS